MTRLNDSPETATIGFAGLDAPSLNGSDNSKHKLDELVRQEVYRVNLSFLHTLRSLSRIAPFEVKRIFGVHASIIDVLPNVSDQGLARAAGCPYLIFKPKGHQEHLLEMLEDEGNELPFLAYLLSSTDATYKG